MPKISEPVEVAAPAAAIFGKEISTPLLSLAKSAAGFQTWPLVLVAGTEVIWQLPLGQEKY